MVVSQGKQKAKSSPGGCDLKKHGSFLPEEDEHLSGLCVLCATWRSCSQASKQTHGSLAATLCKGRTTGQRN